MPLLASLLKASPAVKPGRSRRQSTQKASNGQANHTSRHQAAQNLPVLLPSPHTVDMINAIRKPFLAFAEDFTALTITRAELAPQFMKAFGAFAKDTAGSFVAFVRMLDATVPLDAKDYKKHKIYNVADNLRRLAAEQARGPRKVIPASRRPATPLMALARLVATVLPLVDPQGIVWAAFVKEMHWTESQAKRVQAIGAKVGPVAIQPKEVEKIRRRLAS